MHQQTGAEGKSGQLIITNICHRSLTLIGKSEPLFCLLTLHGTVFYFKQIMWSFFFSSKLNFQCLQGAEKLPFPLWIALHNIHVDHFVTRWPLQLLVPDTMPHFPLIDLGGWELSHCWLYGAPFHSFDQRPVPAVTSCSMSSWSGIQTRVTFFVS